VLLGPDAKALVLFDQAKQFSRRWAGAEFSAAVSTWACARFRGASPAGALSVAFKSVR
jgi:hypothetical protein